MAGKQVFQRCTACHDIGDTPSNRMGPYLTGVVGHPAASVEGFGYSTAMQSAAANGLVWTPETLDQYLIGPRDFVPGTKMPNIRVSKAEDRADLIAYLSTFSPDFDAADGTASDGPSRQSPASQ